MPLLGPRAMPIPLRPRTGRCKAPFNYINCLVEQPDHILRPWQEQAASRRPRFYVPTEVLSGAVVGSVYQLDKQETRHALRWEE